MLAGPRIVIAQACVLFAVRTATRPTRCNSLLKQRQAQVAAEPAASERTAASACQGLLLPLRWTVRKQGKPHCRTQAFYWEPDLLSASYSRDTTAAGHWKPTSENRTPRNPGFHAQKGRQRESFSRETSAAAEPSWGCGPSPGAEPREAEALQAELEVSKDKFLQQASVLMQRVR